MDIKIAIASDHGGFELKNKLYNYLKENNFNVVDFGTNSTESCDYPLYAKKICKSILNNEVQKGILICGTGIGMQISANRFKGIRAVCSTDCYSVKMSREHNNSNVICFGERVIGFNSAIELLNVWLNTEFNGQRHQKRINMIDEE